jgi:hypothetical protein
MLYLAAVFTLNIWDTHVTAFAQQPDRQKGTL